MRVKRYWGNMVCYTANDHYCKQCGGKYKKEEKNKETRSCWRWYHFYCVGLKGVPLTNAVWTCPCCKPPNGHLAVNKNTSTHTNTILVTVSGSINSVCTLHYDNRLPAVTTIKFNIGILINFVDIYSVSTRYILVFQDRVTAWGQ